MPHFERVQKYVAALPLLSKEEESHESSDEEDQTDDLPHEGYRKPRRQKWWYIHLAAFVTYSVVYIVLLIHGRSRVEGAALLPLPAREALKPEFRRFPTKSEDNPFAGKPRKELHDAWHGLLQNDNIRLPKKQIQALSLHSIDISNSNDGVASLSVYHALHCLMMYKEYYHKDKSEAIMAREIRHADHCVEYIRESLMCKPDLSLITFRWINNTSQHPDEPSVFYPTNFDIGQPECMNWEALDKWAGERMFDLYNVSLLDRPAY